jgi:hypothetical protein
VEELGGLLSCFCVDADDERRGTREESTLAVLKKVFNYCPLLKVSAFFFLETDTLG